MKVEFFPKLFNSNLHENETQIHAVVIGLGPNDLTKDMALANKTIDSLRSKDFQEPVLFFIKSWKFTHVKWSFLNIHGIDFYISETTIDVLRIQRDFIDEVSW